MMTSCFRARDLLVHHLLILAKNTGRMRSFCAIMFSSSPAEISVNLGTLCRGNRCSPPRRLPYHNVCLRFCRRPSQGIAVLTGSTLCRWSGIFSTIKLDLEHSLQRDNSPMPRASGPTHLLTVILRQGSFTIHPCHWRDWDTIPSAKHQFACSCQISPESGLGY